MHWQRHPHQSRRGSLTYAMEAGEPGLEKPLAVQTSASFGAEEGPDRSVSVDRGRCESPQCCSTRTHGAAARPSHRSSGRAFSFTGCCECGVRVRIEAALGLVARQRDDDKNPMISLGERRVGSTVLDSTPAYGLLVRSDRDLGLRVESD